MRETQKKGDFAVATAIATFTRMGHDVSLPITESAAYDLVVDTGKTLFRVQVRYSSGKAVELRRIHSNSTGYVIKKTQANAYDWLYVLTDKGKEYLIKQCFVERRSVKPTDDDLIINNQKNGEVA
jgi:hypothetical protein